MEVIPSINTETFEATEERIVHASQFADWLHIDVTDGIFTKNYTWGKPNELKTIIQKHALTTNFEVHLMVTNPELLVEPWIRCGAKRVIVHIETLSRPPELLTTIKLLQAEVMLSSKPGTPVDRFSIYAHDFSQFQILSVDPGLPGQPFQDEALGRIRTLREKLPDVTIEVDGGINLETAQLCRDAGANRLISASYIFNSPDPKAAYDKLAGL
ncbi:MAG: ribulose-phosphate 3-epimerase [Candidatus Harrisonbacteria bacterium CG10_big_fil_rev_8_21_14_0_10_42_17]|uniref:Ribulose-phosphate 3-epimerase n=1 Tax=Candidatus Harrisonbacteria bacterium CG10_big_fil_rev_8_21_14_0_10_42_17 TaxID=1974584 RepID=A0A2M6WIQ9_9BACT|nr:MAG: ribulose-phosphate 3-epimerase [Candidatus Harrisonbacteria bacterium CG10_big_fil_rev_8_21_14_0_10_42_17]